MTASGSVLRAVALRRRRDALHSHRAVFGSSFTNRMVFASDHSWLQLSQFSETFQTDATRLSLGSSNAAIASATGASALVEPEALQASLQIQE